MVQKSAIVYSDDCNYRYL